MQLVATACFSNPGTTSVSLYFPCESKYFTQLNLSLLTQHLLLKKLTINPLPVCSSCRGPETGAFDFLFMPAQPP